MATSTTTRDIVLRMEGKIDALINTVAEHHTDLNGNGRDGLKSDMRAVKSRVETIEECHKEERGDRQKIKQLFWGQVFSLIGLAVAIVIGLR